MKKQFLAQYFDNHITVNEFYITGDGNAFYDDNAAINHAKTLRAQGKKGWDVTKVTRAEYEKMEDELPDGEKIEVKDKVEIKLEAQTIDNLAPVVLTLPQKMALGKAKKKVETCLEALNLAKEGGDAPTIETAEKAYNQAVSALAAMPGYEEPKA